MQTSDFEELLRRHQKMVDKDNAIVEKRLAQMYADSYRKAAADLATLYARLGDKMSLPEAQKYRRLEAVMKSIAREYQTLTGKSILLAVDTSAQNYTEAFYGFRWAVEQSIGVDLTWGVLSVDALRASVFSEDSGLTIIKTFRKNSRQALADIQSIITRGIATGAGYKKTAQEMQGAFVRGYNDAIRVVRTEAGRNYTEGYLASYNEANSMGIDIKNKWSAAKDDRTRTSHGALDGQLEDKNGNFRSILGSVGPGPGLLRGPNSAADIINCRCRLVGVIEGIAPEYVRIRGEGIVPYQTFAQWAEPQGWTRESGWPRVKLL
jgi:SPP1 gp7 family putative phage head morphogenesis protein